MQEQRVGRHGVEPNLRGPVRAVMLGAGVVAALALAFLQFGPVRLFEQQHSADTAAVDVPATSTSTAPTIVASPPTVDAPIAVGTTTIDLVDPTRSTDARGNTPSSAVRSLRVVVRYPTAGMASENEFPDAAPSGQSPLIVFAHGYNASTDTYATLLHDLAASGFVIAAIEFPLTSSAYPGNPIEMDLVNEPADISFVIDSLLARTPPAPLAGAIAKTKVGVIGHSDGAMAVLLTAYAPRYVDPRIGMVVSMAGGYDTYGGTWFSASSAPLLVIHGTLDEITPYSMSEELVTMDPHSVMFVAAQGASHLGSAIAPEYEPSVARVVSESFAWHLLGSTAAAASTLVDADAPPLRLVSVRG
jgi:pimeloyl-ACP methyl ester carboxylesterase